MTPLAAVLRANPGLVVAAALCLGLPLVLLLVGLLLRAVGASLRPVVFLAGLMMPIAVTFLIAELVRARRPGPTPEGTATLSVVEGRFVERGALFGTGIPERQIRDAKAVFPEFFAQADHAELAIVGTGETILVAQFPAADAAKRAAEFLWQSFHVTHPAGSEDTGWRGRRSQNPDYVELLRTGRHLFLWTALTEEACATLRAASAGIPGSPHLQPALREPLFAALQPLDALFRPLGVKVAGVLLMVALYSLWFFKGAAWAGSSPALAGVPVVTAPELARRLESINALDVPFQIRRGERPHELIASWRDSDAKWVDLARAHRSRRTFRIRLTLDDATHTVRATDYVAGYDGSAGADGARMEWRAATGIVFFQVEQRRVFGLKLDEQGRFQPNPSHAYRFHLGEMKTPLVDAVTRSGWNWRPTVCQGPAWLRWLTE